ncbi:unnamed protein product [Effrenium voratum]|nr:unnamed protein product [Effrenium voratum]
MEHFGHASTSNRLMRGWAAIALACGIADAEGDGDCLRLMDLQLRQSHVQDPICQQKIAGVYCARLQEVERPRPFLAACAPPPTEVEATYHDFQEISLAALILAAYQHQLPVLKSLVSSLYHARHHFLIHVDLKSATLLEGLKAWAAPFRNVHVRSQVSVKRSGASLLAAEIYGMLELLNLSAWHYFLVLSDSDQMVRPAGFLERILSRDMGMSFINTEVFNATARSIAVECEARVHSVRMAGHEAVPLRPRLSLASGSQFVVLHRRFAEYVAEGFESSSEALEIIAKGPVYSARIASGSMAREVLNEVLFFASPDETFFHTLAVNSRYCSLHARYNFHFHHTQGHFLDESSRRYTDFPTGSPPVLREEHLPLLLQVRSQHPIIFARKFDGSTGIDVAALQRSTNQLVPAPGDWSPVLAALGLASNAGGSQLLSSQSVFDAAPADFRLTAARAFTLSMGFATRQARAQGTLRLIERYAMSKDYAIFPRWIRVGTGWDPGSLQFRGQCSAVSREASQGLRAVFYWEPREDPREMQIRWRSPDGSVRKTQEVLPAWQLLSVVEAPGVQVAGWWSVEVVIEASSGEDTVLSRRFYVYETKIELAVIQELFSVMPS